MSTPRKSHRPRKEHNYRVLNNGPSLSCVKKEPRSKWSTTKLYSLEILDCKFINEKLHVKVHYTDKEWSSAKYDTWREATDIIDIPDSYVNGTQEQKLLFLEQLKTTIKENLHGQRKVDSIINIEVPVPQNTFSELSCLGCESEKNKSHFILESLSMFNDILGEGWDKRIFNQQGDFAYVVPNTVTFWLKERQPLEDFTPEGNIKIVHRGFCFRMQFARGIGNRFDYQQLIA